MGGKSKRFLKEEAVPTIFSFASELARKRRESSTVMLKNVPKSFVLKKLFPAMKPVQTISIRKTYKSSNLLQKSALARSL